MLQHDYNDMLHDEQVNEVPQRDDQHSSVSLHTPSSAWFTIKLPYVTDCIHFLLSVYILESLC